MKLKNLLLLTGALLPFGSAFGQYAEDALRFSQQEHGVTARFRALGSAQTSLGGDLSSISSNPAGLGLFTKNEISMTTDFTNATNNSIYSNTMLSSSREKLGFNQLGAVFHWSAPKRRGSDLNSGLLSVNFGLGYTKTNNYNGDLRYGGVNGKSSFADYLSDLSDSYLGNGDPDVNSNALPAGTLERMGYNNFLTEYNTGGYFPTTDVDNSQQNLLYTTGSQSEINFAGAVNYNNQLYIGASFSMHNLNYGADREFIESGDTRAYVGQPVDFVGASYTLSYRSAQATQGSGFNGKVGLIYHEPNSGLRLGFSFVSPTWYTIEDSFSEVLDTRYVRADGSAIQPYTNTDEVYNSDYTLRTPFKANIGASMVFGNSGLITGDAEYIDYSSIRFKSNDVVTTNAIRRDITRNYATAVNLRFGGEYKINPIMIRGGVNFMGNPYKSNEYSSRILSAGLGYRKNAFYSDLTYTNSQTEYTSKPYAISPDYPDYPFTGSGETAGITDSRNNFYLTVGVRF